MKQAWPRKKVKALHLEDAEQEAVIQWSYLVYCDYQGVRVPINDFLLAVPNGGKRNPREAARLKKQGVKAGVSDLLLAYPCGGFHGLWIEMKKQGAPPSAVTASQRDWLEKMKALGYQGVVCNGFLDAKKAIKEYLDGRD